MGGCAKWPAAAHGRGRKRNERVHYPIHFAYQEGYTNAVRRPVRVRDLLGDAGGAASAAAGGK